MFNILSPKNVDKLVEKDDFDSLLKRLLSERNEESLKKIIEGLAKIIKYPKNFKYPKYGIAWNQVSECHRRLDICLALEDKQIADLMFKISDEAPLGEFRENDVLRYIVRHGKASEFYQHIISRDREYWRTEMVSREHVFTSTIFLDWIIESGNLSDLFERIDREEFHPWEINDIWGTLLVLILHDRIHGPQSKAQSGITGDTNLALEILRRAKSEHHHYSSDSLPFTYVVGVLGLEEILIDLLASMCSEEVICETLIKCNCFSSIQVLCWVLRKIGSKKSLGVLETVPRDITCPGYITRTTKDPIYMAISGICDRIDTSELKQVIPNLKGFVNKIVSEELRDRTNPTNLPELNRLIKLKKDLKTDYLLSILCDKMKGVSSDAINIAVEQLVSRREDNSIFEAIQNQQVKSKNIPIIFATLFTLNPRLACQCLEYLLKVDRDEEHNLIVDCVKTINSNNPLVTKSLVKIFSKITDQSDSEIQVAVIDALERVSREMPDNDLFQVFSEATNHLNPKIRMIALKALGNPDIWHKKATEFMLAALDDPEPQIKDIAISFLTKVLSDPKQKLLIGEKYCQSSDPKLRSKSIEIVSTCIDSSAEEFVLKMLDDNDDNVVIKAVNNLGKIGSAKSITSLENIKERFSDMQWFIDDAITAIRKRL